MNKRTNTILFILGASLFNVVVAIISFITLLFLYANFLSDLLPPQVHQWGVAVIFLGSLAISFIAYQRVLKYIVNKVDVDKYFEPIFTKKIKKN